MSRKKKIKIRPYLKDIHDLKKSDMRKTQLMIALYFMSSKGNDKERVIHSKSDKIEIMNNDYADKFIEELFQSHLSRHQIGLETSIKGSYFVFNCVHLLYYKCHKNKSKSRRIIYRSF